jgi:hypothetical protein
MNQISETFLLTMAWSATLPDPLIVAAFFYVETGLRRVSTNVPEARSDASDLRDSVRAHCSGHDGGAMGPAHAST